MVSLFDWTTALEPDGPVLMTNGDVLSVYQWSYLCKFRRVRHEFVGGDEFESMKDVPDGRVFSKKDIVRVATDADVQQFRHVAVPEMEQIYGDWLKFKAVVCPCSHSFIAFNSDKNKWLCEVCFEQRTDLAYDLELWTLYPEWNWETATWSSDSS
jgi:hypothetical protein